jgi:lipoprotein LpqH
VRNRFVAVAGATACAVAVVAGCSSETATSPQPPGALPPVTAQITVNGKPAGTTNEIHCTQDGWLHTIETGDEHSGVRVVVRTGDQVNAESVVINNVGDFNGSVWPNNVGKADATMIGNTFRINGTAEGATTANPNRQTTASFDIKANC